MRNYQKATSTAKFFVKTNKQANKQIKRLQTPPHAGSAVPSFRVRSAQWLHLRAWRSQVKSGRTRPMKDEDLLASAWASAWASTWAST